MDRYPPKSQGHRPPYQHTNLSILTLQHRHKRKIAKYLMSQRTIRQLSYTRHLLLSILTHWCHHHTTWFQLLQQLWWQVGRTTRYQHLIKRHIRWQPLKTIPIKPLYTGVPLQKKEIRNILMQRLLSFYSKQLHTKLSQHTTLVSTARTYLQHLLKLFHTKQLCLVSNSIWLRYSLPRHYRESPVFIGLPLKCRIKKKMSWYSLNSSQHLFIPYTSFSQAAHQLPAQTLMAIVVLALPALQHLVKLTLTLSTVKVHLS